MLFLLHYLLVSLVNWCEGLNSRFHWASSALVPVILRLIVPVGILGRGIAVNVHDAGMLLADELVITYMAKLLLPDDLLRALAQLWFHIVQHLLLFVLFHLKDLVRLDHPVDRISVVQSLCACDSSQSSSTLRMRTDHLLPLLPLRRLHDFHFAACGWITD